MDKTRVFVFTVFFMLGVLFLSTIGSYWTGYSTLSNEEITLKHFPYPFIKSSNYNNLYIVIPDESTLEEQNTAYKISKSLQYSRLLPPQIVTLSNLPDVNNNLILIGDSCTNNLIRLFVFSEDCTFNLKKGEGMLKLVQREKYFGLIVSGYGLNEIGVAGNVLVNYGAFPLKGREIIVKGSSNDISAYSLLYKN